MKKATLSITVLVMLIATALMLICGTTVTAQTTKSFVYDRKENSKTVFSLDQSTLRLTRELKYEYKYDVQGVMTEKKAYRWNHVNNSWRPYYLLSAKTSGNESTLEYAEWNEKTTDFDKNLQRTLYYVDDTNKILSYTSYRWDMDLLQWQQDQHFLLQHYLADGVVNNK